VRLAGEKAVVTGSTSGLGRAIAVELAREGAAVVVTGRDQARGDAVVAEIAATGGSAHFVAADLGDEQATTQLIETAATRLNGLTVLVNNAAGGDAADGPIGDLTTEAWETILRVDLTAPKW
jgi:NAD(P)-dependent dehydrogenase (short-subunit alcohol dehydrogenase family)